MKKNCKQCEKEFEITDEDLKFYDKVSDVIKGKKYSLPSPTHCPDCRLMRRLLFRNEKNLYKRKCDLCGKSGIFVFPENSKFPVYCVDCFWSDKWDPLKYGRDYDFSRSFFEQFKNLMNVVPKMGLYHLSNENSEFNSFIAYSKNTYMSPGSHFLQDCVYSRKSHYSKDCLNCLSVGDSELMEGSSNSSHCYDCKSVFNCSNCSDCFYMADSIGCSNCFMCSGLNKKSFCIKNKQYSKEEYEKLVEEESQTDVEKIMNEFIEFNKTIPKKYQNQMNCENSLGDFIQNCKNAEMCFDSFNVQDAKYVVECEDVKDSMDVNMHDKNIQLCYEMSCGGDGNYMSKFNFCSCVSPESSYLFACFYASECFGCDGINSKTKNCILNKQYSKDEYEVMKGKIIEQMIKNGEYGEFFPISISPFAYNETVANDYFPMTKEEVLKRGWKWKDRDLKEFLKSEFVVPSKIEDTKDEVLNYVFSCNECGKNYKIVSLELDISRKMKSSLSKKCPDCRQKNLMKFKNSKKLFDRNCDNCDVTMKTTYLPEYAGKVYCEKCYLKQVY
ncbi:hypothetical protein M0P48_03015 [Candidatus Gracilibacteria bacterium]|jgi:hypothetical protein|nr:hypothetical protein [Candidatus Gracilibacteria bacterium]